MDIHKNARLTLRSREELAELFSPARDSQRRRTALSGDSQDRRQVGPPLRRRAPRGSATVPRDRIAVHAPHFPELVDRVIELRRQHTPGYQIARATGLSPASVSRILRRVHLSRWRDLHPAPPVVRYEHPFPAICCISTSRA